MASPTPPANQAEIARLNSETAMNIAQAWHLYSKDLLKEVHTYDPTDPKQAAALFDKLYKSKDVIPGLVATKDKDTGPPLIIDVSRLPGVAKALSAGRTDPMAHIKQDMMVLDAPEPKYGASDVAFTMTDEPLALTPESEMSLTGELLDFPDLDAGL